MSTPMRPMIIELFVGLGVCAGAYFLGVVPLEQRLAQTRASLAQLQARAAVTDPVGSDPRQLAALLAQARECLERTQTASAPAQSESATFSALMSLAGEQRVRVEQIQPSTPRTLKKTEPPAPQPGAPGAPAAPNAPAPLVPPVPKDRRAACSLTVSGSFADVTSFIGALPERLGFCTVRAVRLSPIMGVEPPRVIAAIETEHVALDTAGIVVAPPENATTQPIAGVEVRP